jgi:hypothetical protein
MGKARYRDDSLSLVGKAEEEEVTVIWALDK